MSGGRVEERAREVQELRAQGLPHRVIAERLGISVQYSKRLVSTETIERHMRVSRDAKRKRRGVCVDCGGETRYHGKGKLVGDRCQRCANARVGLAKRGTGEITESVLEFLATPRRYMEIREFLGEKDDYVSSMLYQRLLPYGLVRRVRRGWYVATPEEK